MKFNPPPSTLQLGMGEYFVYSNKQKAQFQKRTFSEKKKRNFKITFFVDTRVFYNLLGIEKQKN